MKFLGIGKKINYFLASLIPFITFAFVLLWMASIEMPAR